MKERAMIVAFRSAKGASVNATYAEQKATKLVIQSIRKLSEIER